MLQPGQYNWTGTFTIKRDNTVVLGLGLATLISTGGNAGITVEDNIEGVKIAGILFQAGEKKTHALLQWGRTDTSTIATKKYGSVMSDVYTRVGGPNDPAVVNMTADTMVEILSNEVIIDNAWLWRADHSRGGAPVKDSSNPCTTALRVKGDGVYSYGMAAEHTLGNMVEWYGDKGQVFFYQSEYPYDVTQENYADKGFVSYWVSPDVKQHFAYGIGVYSYFRDHEVWMDRGISAPKTQFVTFTNAFTRLLNGLGGIKNVINDDGVSISANKGLGYDCTYTYGLPAKFYGLI